MRARYTPSLLILDLQLWNMPASGMANEGDMVVLLLAGRCRVNVKSEVLGGAASSSRGGRESTRLFDPSSVHLLPAALETRRDETGVRGGNSNSVERMCLFTACASRREGAKKNGGEQRRSAHRCSGLIMRRSGHLRVTEGKNYRRRPLSPPGRRIGARAD